MYTVNKGIFWLFTFVDVVQSLSCVWLFVTPWTAARQASLSFTISQSLLKLMSTESVMPSNCVILCHPLLLPSIFPSIRVFCYHKQCCNEHWGTHIFLTYDFLRIYASSGTVGSYGSFVSSFLEGISILFSIKAGSIYIPTSHAEGFPSLHMFSSSYYL